MTPLNKKIQLEIKEVEVGMIQSEAIEEHGTILAIGSEVDAKKFPIGKELYFKAWAVDVITESQEKLYFISSDSDAICAIE